MSSHRRAFAFAAVFACVAVALVGCTDRTREAANDRIRLVIAEQVARDAECVKRLLTDPSPADVAFDCNEKRAMQLERYTGLITMVPEPKPGEIPPFPAVPVEITAAPKDGDGRRLFFTQKCSVCHSLDGTALVGQSMKGLYGSTITHTDGSTAVVDDAYLREAILQPGTRVTRGFVPTMPVYEGKLNVATVDVIIAFIKTL